ncbi:G-protein alpha subunit-domain-containing protein [Lentinula detonsa]|uniref:G-protein alpha subunit-domain-containing protein n=1 Tax=Lentinula detonsa TaxID=2804962 RepID=A0AA38UPH3_9AGAR|nr:G-protein alpha subunit-domain-containing protein [Lentinula detonsa]
MFVLFHHLFHPLLMLLPDLPFFQIYLKDQPGFFLEDVERITKEDYLPTPDDVLRARVSTIGPEEHRIPMESSLENGNGKDWIVYDVGGDRSQRAAWAQFFDTVTVIIFLAPVSAFNQALAEDETVNRLADSMKLWRMICTNKLLASVDLILLLNKIDVLDAQLKAGVHFSKYVTSFRDKPNETEAVSKYLLDMFTALHKQHSPSKKRKMHPHLTCAIDTKATADPNLLTTRLVRSDIFQILPPILQFTMTDFRANKPSDVISTLVSIYDSRDLFVKELRLLPAQCLLAIIDDDTEKVENERRNIEILKIHFGETALQVCEVMLRDMTNS